MEEVKDKVTRRTIKGRHWPTEERVQLDEWDNCWNVGAEISKFVWYFNATRLQTAR